jgi:hypothetical protein
MGTVFSVDKAGNDSALKDAKVLFVVGKFSTCVYPFHQI